MKTRISVQDASHFQSDPFFLSTTSGSFRPVFFWVRRAPFSHFHFFVFRNVSRPENAMLRTGFAFPATLSKQTEDRLKEERLVLYAAAPSENVSD